MKASRRPAVAALLACALPLVLQAQGKPYAFKERDPKTKLEAAIEKVLPCVVKVHGASGLATIEAYSSGVIVSPQGHVLAIDLVMMQRGSTKIVLADGSIHPAELLDFDDKLGVRLLRIEDLKPGEKLPYYLVPSTRRDLRNGTLLFSVGNCCRLAEFSEKNSVTFGVLTARARTGLRYRLQDVEYDGEMLITDAMNNPGHEGGGLFTRDGEWVGLNAKIVESTETNTQLSAAIPIWEIVPFLERAIAGKPSDASADAPKGKAGFHGIIMFDKGGRTSPPPYLEGVAPGSPAEKLGLMADDMIVQVGDNSIRTCREFRHFMSRYAAGQKVKVIYKRGSEIKHGELVLEGAK